MPVSETTEPPPRADVSPAPSPAAPAEAKPDRADRTSDGRDARRDEGGDGKARPDGERKSRWPLLILAIVVILGVVGGTTYWLMTRGEESTDDAYTDGNAIVIAPKISGYVTELAVNDNTLVKAGQVLFRIDAREYLAARDQARANLSLARAQLQSAEVNLEVTRVRAPAQLDQAEARVAEARANQDQAAQNYRRQHAVDPRATTQVNVDQANAQLKAQTAQVGAARADAKVAALVQQTIQTAEAQVKQAQAQVAQAEANLAQAEVNLSYTDIVAPADGRVTKRNVDRGSYVQAGQQSFYIVTPQVWVTANFKENQLADMKPGQPVTISVDAYPSLELHGHVDSIQQGSGAQFSAFPPENATGNFVKIVRRVPVKVIVDRGLPPEGGLPLGISVEATVDVQ
jgi:membrane fusion protein (multidrug efflux system)